VTKIRAVREPGFPGSDCLFRVKKPEIPATGQPYRNWCDGAKSDQNLIINGQKLDKKWPEMG